MARRRAMVVDAVQLEALTVPAAVGASIAFHLRQRADALALGVWCVVCGVWCCYGDSPGVVHDKLTFLARQTRQPMAIPMILAQ